jgi:hypothetical protein
VKAWEIWTYDPGFGNHPAIIISHPDRTANKPIVEFLLGYSQRASRAAIAGEVLLDAADGLGWETLCRCDLIWSDDRKYLHNRRGLVSAERRKQIVRAILSSHDWVFA